MQPWYHERRARAVARHRATLFGTCVDGYLDALEKQGHPASLRLAHLQMVTRFGEHLATRGVHVIADIRPEHIESFRRHERQRKTRERRRRRSTATHPVCAPTGRIRAFLAHLEEQGIWRRVEKAPRPLIQDFYRSLEEERGLKPATIELYRHFVTKFLAHLGSDGSARQLGGVCARDVDRFLVNTGRKYSRKSMGCVCTAVRGFLRHLFRAGVLRTDLAQCVILPHFYALERLPCALPWEKLLRLRHAPDLTTRAGLRDRAMLAVLLSYGVRAGEVVELRLDDIDWRRNIICFRRSKAGRPLSFPLMKEAGDALFSYVKDGRPKTDAREVFVRCLAPFTALSAGNTVSTRVDLLLAKAGIEASRRGAGILRHSLAVHMVRNGHALKAVSDLLGHRDPGTAYHYTKLATEDLRDVALSAREVLP